MSRLRMIVNLIAIALIIIAATHLAFHREPPVARINSILFTDRKADSASGHGLLTARIYDVRDIVRRQIAADKSSPALSEQEVMDQINSMVLDLVTPHDWVDTGGSTGSINESSHWLIVLHTPEGHRAIASLLDTIRRADSFQWPRRSQPPANDSKEQ